MKRTHIIIVSLWLCLLLLGTGSASGQKRIKTTVRIEVSDTGGAPVEYAGISSSRNRYTYTTDRNGQLEVSVGAGDVLKIMADGYATQAIPYGDIKDGQLKVTLEKLPAYADEQSRIFTVTGDEISERRTVGAYSKVDGSELEANPTTFLWDALGGRLGGLFLMDQTLAPGFSQYEGFVRAPNGGTPIVMIDGVERSLEYIEPETIESVQLLKDASLKSLFGGIQTNGILMIKTKRGKAYENGVRVNVQSGVQVPTRLPKYLNSRDYTTMYNQALQNVGMSPIFSPEKYDGSDPLLYPDVDYYDEFLNDVMTITRANAQLTGGSKNTQYFVHLGYQTNGGLEKYTDYPNNDQVVTVRGNVDNTIYDFITLKAGLNAALQNKKWPNMSTTDFFGMLSDNRPNEFPITIPGSMVGSSDEYVLGGTDVNRNNPLGMLTRNGYVEREYSYVQSDFTLNIDLGKWVEGLTIRPAVTFDFYNEFSSRKDGGFSVTQLVPGTDGGQTTFRKWGYDNPNTKLVRGQSSTRRNWAFSTTATYDRTFGKHALRALATYFMQQQTFHNKMHSLKRVNLGGMVNYMYDNKYVIDASLNYVGVPSFSPDERFGLFPTVGAAWILSENSFMRDSRWIDYFKLRASYGVLGSTSYDDVGLVSNYYYRDEWQAAGTYEFSSFANIARLTQTGNPHVGFQKSHEFNAGVDFEFFDRSLSGSVGYFRNKLEGGLANLNDVVPGVSGKGPALIWRNYKEFVSQGVEAELYYTKRFGDWTLTAGGNLSYGYSDATREADVDYPDELSGLRKIRRVGDMKGLQVIGTFADEADIAASPVQTYGTVYPGDLKYRDRNDDGIIDERDKTEIANIQPSLQYGITLKVKYKNFNLDILGYGLGGFDRMLTNKYYQNFGERKYSNVLRDGLPNGNPHPVLRASTTRNNFEASDYWVVDGGYFKLRNVELGYTLPHHVSKKIGLNVLKVYVRATNLFTISKIKDLDPECLNAGIGDFPLFSTITGGVTFSF